MSVPLVHRDQVLGVLNVNAAAGTPSRAYDLRALSLFAEQAAVAIANARLFDAERTHVVELVELDRLKSEFLNHVTHELRTPLTVVLAAAQTGLQPKPAGRDGRAVRDHRAQREEPRLDGRGDAHRRRLEQGGRRAEPSEVDVAELVRTVARDFGVTDRPVEVEVEDGLIGDERPRGAPTDPRQPARQRAQVRRAHRPRHARARRRSARS